jgi:hypothetical protein
MAAAGEVSPMPTCAIFSDTGDEPESVYRWLDWLEKQLPFPVHRVSMGAKLSDLATKVMLSKKSGNTYVKLGIPCFTVTQAIERPIIDWEEDELTGDENEVYGPPEPTLKKGMGMRQCTRSAKIDPIRRFFRKLRGGKTGPKIIQWIGISRDEVIRMKPSRDKWCENIWPLVDRNMTRADCLAWMKAKNHPTPPRSACVYCPYHSDKEWLRLKTEEPREFIKAVVFETRLQQAYVAASGIHSFPYLHASRKPLNDVDFTAKENNQPELFGNECEGMCGV